MSLGYAFDFSKEDTPQVEELVTRSLSSTVPERFPQAGSPWAIADDVANLLRTIVVERRPPTIVEYGVGRSTSVLAQALSESGQRVVSVDESETQIHETRGLIGNDKAFEFHHAPTGLIWAHGTPFGGYRLPKECLRSMGKSGVDLAFIDGPANYSANRAAALYQLWQYLNPGAWVVLDDAGRPRTELQALIHWHRAAGGQLGVHLFSQFERGLAVLTLRIDGAKKPLCVPNPQRLLNWVHLPMTVRQLRSGGRSKR